MENFNLDRFVDAQRQTYQSALEELKSGRKDDHWMWYIFPQMQGLGGSEISRFFGMTGIDEAAAYLSHDVLGKRLVHCTEVVFAKPERSARAIFGHPDCLKFGSCLTLFERVADAGGIFAVALEKRFAGRRCGKTLELIEAC